MYEYRYGGQSMYKKMRSSMYHVVNKIQVFNTKRVFWIPEILTLYTTVKDGIFL